MVALDILTEILQQHYKGLMGIASIDCIFLAVLGITYVYKGDISYSQFFNAFSLEAYLSILIVTIVSFVVIYILYPTKARNGHGYIS